MHSRAVRELAAAVFICPFCWSVVQQYQRTAGWQAPATTLQPGPGGGYARASFPGSTCATTQGWTMTN